MGHWKQLTLDELQQLKSGDKIRIRGKDNVVTADANKCRFLVAEEYKDSKNKLSQCFAYCCGYEDHLIPVHKLTGETTMKTKQFTKADLKTGYRLILEDGEVGIVFMDSDIISLPYSRNWVKYINHSNGFDDLDCWDNKLNPAESTWVSKVVRVEKPSHAPDIFKLDCKVKIIWEREAPKSKEQIAYDEAVEATEAARQAYELAQKKLEALNPANK